MPTDTTVYGTASRYTLDTLRTQLYKELKEDPSDPQFWDSTEMTNYINDAIQSFCEQANLFTAYDEINSAENTFIYKLTADMANIIGFGFDGTDITDEQIDVDKIDIVTKGVPNSWGRYGISAVFVNPIPDATADAKKILILYSCRHAVLTGNDDPILIHNLEILEGIKSYVKWKALEKDGHGQDIIKSKTHRKAYWGALDYARLKLSNDNSPMSMGGDY